MPGYHNAVITRGQVGELSKIQEELDELRDAEEQQCKILMLVELSDLIGAVDCYLKLNFPGWQMADLNQMSILTTKAFKEGHRQ